MRLTIHETGHNLLQKLQFKIIKTFSGQVPSPMKIISYRNAFFGRKYSVYLQKAMRETKFWTVPEVELLAAYISKCNECKYCISDHKAIAIYGYNSELVETFMDKPENSDIDNKLNVTIKFLEKLCKLPSEVNENDLKPLFDSGLSKQAVEEAIHICGIMCTMNRLADAFNFPMSTNLDKLGKFLFKNGYKLVCIKGFNIKS